VSGGSVEFMRPWSERVYGIPPEQVVGTQNAMRFESQGGAPALLREPKIDFVDDGPGKPVGIYKHIGRRRARIRVRPAEQDRTPRQGVGRRAGQGLERGQHATRLDSGVRATEELMRGKAGNGRDRVSCRRPGLRAQ